jgi:hypothetical protein
MDGIEIGGESSNAEVKKNQIMGPAGRGILVGKNLVKGGGENITIIDNNLRDLHYGCMLVQNAEGVIIHRNRLSNC